MSSTEHEQYLRRLRFPDDIESAFQRDYYTSHRNMARITMWFLALYNATLIIIATYQGHYAPALVLLLTLLANSSLLWRFYHQPYVRSGQPLGLVICFLTLGATLCFFFLRSTNKFEDLLNTIVPLCFLFPLLTRKCLQLQRRWVLPLYLMTLTVFLSWSYLLEGRKDSLSPRDPLTTTIRSDSTTSTSNSAIETVQPPLRKPSEKEDAQEYRIMMAISLSILFVIEWFLSGNNERSQRREFLETYLLERERDEERDKRQHTENMLHVLSQAIGGIVHDLGNPLTNVQTGAQTLRYFVEDEDSAPDRETVLEFSEIILDGAQMLNYLRLSLMEQTRVLESKPIPIELAKTSLRRIAEAGAQYQKPKFVAGRKIQLPEDDVELLADEMKLITVFMNLIGNALKYSDGPVRIASKTHGETLLVGIIDRGKKGRGISPEQAQKLFVPFGRLDTHSNIEGTGLGLLSVRAIAQAHNGDIYIEGREDGTPASAAFSTAKEAYPTLLQDGDCTAFILACPLRPNKIQIESPNGNSSNAQASNAPEKSTQKPIEQSDAQPALIKA